MSTNFSPSAARRELEAMNLHSHSIFKNPTNEVQNRRYLENLREIAGAHVPKDLNSENESVYTRVH